MEHWFTNVLLAARPWAAWAETMLTSWLAWRIYALLGGAIIVALSLWNANRHRDVIVEPSIRPSRAKTKRGIRDALNRLDQLIKGGQSAVFRQALLVLFYGFLIPSTVLGLAIYFYPWFVPGQSALSTSGCPHSVTVSPTFFGTGVFVFSQLAMGMANTVSGLATGALGNAIHGYTPANGIVAAAVVGYRYFIGLFAGAFAHLVYAALRMPATPKLVQQRQDLLTRLAAADH